ncbi:tetratricopeptide repeat protein 16 [Antennarius striatus]|uniref:tetratricopeptide repeat protein 16 n=1 Tax=Antennarius striatus TaxID=241820 RepID=UPI0035B00D72
MATAAKSNELTAENLRLFLTEQREHVRRPGLQGSQIIHSRAAELFESGKEAAGKSNYEKAVIYFSKAISLQPNQTQLHVSQAEAYLQLCDFQSAAACYNRAELLEPTAFRTRLSFIYYLQGQCLFDQGFYQVALETFGKAAEMKPGCRAYEVRRLACLTAAGHHGDCLKLVNDWMLSDGHTSDLYILRARLHKLLNKTLLCYEDIKSALALNPTCPNAGVMLLQSHEVSEQARQKAVDRALTGQLPEALCLTNIALEYCQQNAWLYMFRGILHRRLKDFRAAIEDLIQAVELSEEKEEIRGQSEAFVQEEAHFQLVLTFNDLAIQCFSRRLFAEATLLLNKAIEEEKGQAGLYLNRGDCFFKQTEWWFALADYRQAEDMMQPDDPTVRLRLAVLHNTLGFLHFQDGHFREAADMFSLAIQYNPTASQYYENRSKAYRKLLNMKCARQDFICMLILEPTNEEVSPMLMHLFPGYSVSDVLSTPEGQAVRVQLMDTIQACSPSPDQQRVNESLQKMTLTNTLSPSEELSEAGKELKLCVNQEEMQMLVKSSVQVKETVSIISP